MKDPLVSIPIGEGIKNVTAFLIPFLGSIKNNFLNWNGKYLSMLGIERFKSSINFISLYIYHFNFSINLNNSYFSYSITFFY